MSKEHVIASYAQEALDASRRISHLLLSVNAQVVAAKLHGDEDRLGFLRDRLMAALRAVEGALREAPQDPTRR